MYGSRFLDALPDAAGSDYVPRHLRAVEPVAEPTDSQGPIEPLALPQTALATLERVEPAAEPVTLPLVTVPTGRGMQPFPHPADYAARRAAADWPAAAAASQGLFRRRVDPARLSV